MSAKIDSSLRVTQNTGIPLEPKKESYSLSTQSLCRIDDILKVALAITSYGMIPEAMVSGAAVGAFLPPLRSAPVRIFDNGFKENEEKIRGEKIFSISASILLGAIMQTNPYFLPPHIIAGIYGIQVLRSYSASVNLAQTENASFV